MGGDEAILEVVEQLCRHPLLGRKVVAEQVVVLVADDLETLGREAIEEAEQLTLRPQDVLDVGFDREQIVPARSRPG